MNKVKKITKESFVNLLKERGDILVHGATFSSITALTPVKDLVKPKSNPFNGLTKLTVANVMLFQNKLGSAYENKVKRQLVKEGKDPEQFKLSPLSWGERIKDTPLIYHKGEYYLQVIFLKNTSTKYFFENDVVEKENVFPYLREKKEGDQGGLEDKVIIRTYKIDSLISLTLNEKTYQFV